MTDVTPTDRADEDVPAPEEVEQGASMDPGRQPLIEDIVGEATDLPVGEDEE